MNLEEASPWLGPLLAAFAGACLFHYPELMQIRHICSGVYAQAERLQLSATPVKTFHTS